MTNKQIKTLILMGEGYRIEFKQALDKSLVEEVCAFANSSKFGIKSVPRNLLIASMLHRANYIEKAGTGINRIKQSLSKHKKKIHLNIKYSKDSLFYSVIFKKKGLVETPSKGLVETPSKGLVETPSKGLVETPSKGLVENQSKILEMIIENPTISKQKMAETIGISSTAIDKNVDALKKKGFIKRIGPDKGGRWKVIKK